MKFIFNLNNFSRAKDSLKNTDNKNPIFIFEINR